MINNTTHVTVLFLLLTLNAYTGIPVPNNALRTNDVQTFEKNYIKHQYNIDDFRAISFTYEQIKVYLNYLENRSKKLNINEEILGVQIYFGAKKEKEFGVDISPKGSIKSFDNAEDDIFTTIFLTPTLNKSNSNDAGDYESLRKLPNPYIPSDPCSIININEHKH